MMEKLTKGDVRLIVICAVMCVISLVVVQRYFRTAFPEAAIEFELTREQAAERAEGYVASRGWDVDGYVHASRFVYEYWEKTFLERQRDAEEAGRIFTEVNGWRWANRWFKPGQKEEFRVDFSTTGEIAFFEHVVAEDAPGDSLSRETARDIAEFYLAGRLDWDATRWELVSAETERLDNRHDHEFVWKEAGFDVDGGTHRVTVRVQGDEVGLYNEWIEVPDTWKRDYRLLRSRNNLANEIASVFLYVTTMVLVVMLFIRARRKDVRWKAAWAFGAAVAVLFLLQSLNWFSSWMFYFDTKDSFASFVFTRIILSGLLGGPISGFFMAMLLAGAEPWYREAYPRQIAFRHMLTARGLRTRSFLTSAVIGISLTFFFLAYQTVFYLISNRFGGWSPTEVSNINALDTPIPWVAVLMGGLLPAISEESLSRMFTIPFLQKYARSTFLAVLLGAVIWGFGHSSYPAQPFYIRGVEVSIGGIIIGYVFLRYGFLAVLIWHFSVDAVYSAAVLIQSGNEYYVTTGIVSAGVIALPLVYAIVAAVRHRGFVPAQELTNARDVSPAVVAAPAPVEKLRPVLAYSGLTGRARTIGIVLIGLGIVVIFLAPRIGRPHLARFDKTRSEAVEAAQTFLDGAGLDLDGYRSVARSVQFLGDRRDGRTYAYNLEGSKVVPAYLFEQAGWDAINDVYTRHVSPTEWQVRYFKPLEKTEYNVYVDGASGSVSGLSFELPDTASLPSFDQDDAVSLARRFLTGVGRTVDGYEVVDRMTEERENRIDHTFRFQTEAFAGEAHLVYNVTVHGDHVGSYNADVKIPEDWKREYKKTRVLEVVGGVGIFVLFIGLIAAWIVTVVKVMRVSRPRWRTILLGAAALAAIGLVINLNNWPTIFAQYDTSVPVGSYLSSVFMGNYFVSATAVFAMFVLLAASAAMMDPDAFRALRGPNRAPRARDAVLSAGAAVGAYLIVTALGRAVETRFPSSDWSRFSAPDVDVASVGLGLVAGACLGAAIWFLVVVIVQYMYRRYLTTRRRKVTVLTTIALLLTLALGSDAPGATAFFARFVEMGIAIGLVLLMWRLFWGDNPVAMLVGILVLSAALGAEDLVLGGPAYRVELWIALVVLATPILLLALESSRARSRAARA